ncbi:MAG TPA: BON domain-containing protein [Burkholderiales bacterium]|nr:BON domain-containing protein [Burkholderiales bacterium]
MRFLRVVVLLLVAGFSLAQVQGCAPTETRRSVGRTVDDATITARVKTALLADKDVSGLDVKVDTYRGVVQLSGFVDNAEQAARAEQIAQGIGGVRSVRNEIQVKPPRS